MNIFSNFFPTKETDLTGKDFKNQFQHAENPILIDVRTPSEYASGTIPGAKNIDFMSPDFQTNMQKLDPENTYFLFCRSGTRSSGAASLLEKQGVKYFNLLEGISSWPL